MLLLPPSSSICRCSRRALEVTAGCASLDLHSLLLVVALPRPLVPCQDDREIHHSHSLAPRTRGSTIEREQCHRILGLDGSNYCDCFVRFHGLCSGYTENRKQCELIGCGHNTYFDYPSDRLGVHAYTIWIHGGSDQRV